MRIHSLIALYVFHLDFECTILPRNLMYFEVIFYMYCYYLFAKSRYNDKYQNLVEGSYNKVLQRNEIVRLKGA